MATFLEVKARYTLGGESKICNGTKLRATQDGRITFVVIGL